MHHCTAMSGSESPNCFWLSHSLKYKKGLIDEREPYMMDLVTCVLNTNATIKEAVYRIGTGLCFDLCPP